MFDEPSALLRPFLRWARRYVVPLAIAVAVGALIGAILPSGETLYRTSVVVIPTKTDIPLDNMGSIAQAAFQTDTVMLPVIRQLGLNVTPQQLVASKQLTIQPVSTTGALSIVAESRDPKLARDLVKAAASSFIAAAGQKGLGTFAQFGGGVSPTAVPPPSFAIRSVAGAAVAFLLGLIVLVVVYVLTRPVMSKTEAQGVLPARQAFGVKLSRRATRTPSRHGSRGFRVQPSSFYDGLRGALAERNGDSRPVGWIYVGPRRGRTREQAMYLVTALHDNDQEHAETDGPVLVSAQEPLTGAVLHSGVVVMFVAAGVRRDDLVHAGEELDASPGKPELILVFVDTR